MTRSLLNAKVVSAFIVDQTMAMIISRRGYAAGTSDGIRQGGAAVKRAVEESKEVPWIPDPVTGFYRPENMIKREVPDAAELRAELLGDKKHSSN